MLSLAQTPTTPAPTNPSGNPPQDGNAEALRAFQRQAGDQAPTLAKDEAGNIKLEWRGSLSLDAYRNDVTPPPGQAAFASPFATGTRERTVFTTEIRLVEPNGAAMFLQAGSMFSNDRAVLSRYPSQLSQLQAGRTTARQNLTVGDVVANYSGLGTSLGMRGLALTQRLGDFSLSAHAGKVAESWDALLNRKPIDGGNSRNQYLRNVFGLKGEYSHSPQLRSYVTWQSFDDSKGSLPEALATAATAHTVAASGGFAWQGETTTLAGELARSSFHREQLAERRADAFVLDGTWRVNTLSLRAGYHEVDADFVSLAQSVPPGVREGYVGFDWPATTWLSVGADWRDALTRYAMPTLPPVDDSAFALLPPPLAPEPTLARGFNTRATINFGPSWPGWNLSIQNAETANGTVSGITGRGRNTNITLSFAAKGWNGSLTLGDGFNRQTGNPAGDSTMESIQFQAGRSFVHADRGGTPLLTLTVSGMAGRQTQRLPTMGNRTDSTQYGLVLAGQHRRFGQLNLQWNDAVLTQPLGGPDLVTRTLQFDFTHPFGAQRALKAYLRHVRRNMGAPQLETTEKLGGVQLSLTW